MALKHLEFEIWRFCRDLYRDPVRGRLLVIYGVNGTGKTHCAKAVYHWALRTPVQYVETPNVVNALCANTAMWAWPELLDAFKNGDWSIVDWLKECALLILDELGGGHDPSFVGVDKLCQVLSRRENKWTLVTTNIPPAAWPEKFDLRVASRLMGNSTIVDLSGVPDYRPTH